MQTEASFYKLRRMIKISCLTLFISFAIIKLNYNNLLLRCCISIYFFRFQNFRPPEHYRHYLYDKYSIFKIFWQKYDLPSSIIRVHIYNFLYLFKWIVLFASNLFHRLTYNILPAYIIYPGSSVTVRIFFFLNK